MGIYFYEGGILFNSGDIAFHEDCCCGDLLENCSFCSSGVAPKQLEATIAGVTNNTCTGCAAFNGTHVLDNVFQGGTWCQWCKLLAQVSCPSAHGLAIVASVFYDVPLDEYWLAARLTITTNPTSDCGSTYHSSLYRKSYGGSKPDCAVFSDEVLAYYAYTGQPPGCNIPSTITISTI